jgi:hypothetical protein
LEQTAQEEEHLAGLGLVVGVADLGRELVGGALV